MEFFSTYTYVNFVASAQTARWVWTAALWDENVSQYDDLSNE